MSSNGAGTILFGGSGFLGPYILGNYPEIISVGRTPPPTPSRHIPIQSLANLDPLRDVEFDKVIYIIGNTDHYNLEKENVPSGELNAFDYHVTPLIQTLEQLKGRAIRKFIHFSSILVYDDKRISIPVSEHSPIDPYKNRYVLSKYLAEEASKFYGRWMPTITIRLSNIYGPTPLQRFDLVHLLCRQLLEQGKARMWTTRPKRDFIYVDDASHAIVKLLDSDYTGTLNLGTGTMTQVSKVKETLEAVSGASIEVMDIPVSGPLEFQCDMTTMNRLIDWQPKYGVEAGVRLTYETMKRYRQQCGSQ